MKLILDGTLPSLNEYIQAERSNRYAAAKIKSATELYITLMIKNQLRGWQPTGPVEIAFRWCEKNRRRDKDNVCFAKKFILDALQRAGTLSGDGWRQVAGFTDSFAVDKQRPRVEIEITEVEEWARG